MSEFVDLYDRNRKFLNRVVDRNTYLFQHSCFYRDENGDCVDE